MGKSKKLDISLEKLVSIALSINENTIANKHKLKEEKISTDKFIQQFNINRKDFSFTIKDTEINYNKSTFLYDVPQVLISNNVVTNADTITLEEHKSKSNYKVTTEDIPQSNNKVTIIEKPKSNQKVTPITNLKTLPMELQKVINQSADIDEMLSWYKHHKDDDKIIEVPEIDVNHIDLQGELMVRSFKTYAKVLDKFTIFCKGKKEMQKDLIALALVEFMGTYK